MLSPTKAKHTTSFTSPAAKHGKLQLSTAQGTYSNSLAPTVNSPIASRTPKKTFTPHGQITSPSRFRALNGKEDDQKKDTDIHKAAFQSSMNLLAMEDEPMDTLEAPEGTIFSPAAWRGDSSNENSQHSSKRSSNENTPLRGGHERLYQDIEEDYEAYLFMKNIPPIPQSALARPAALPPKTSSDHEYTLVLDLDETLVHCSVEAVEKYELIFPVNFNGANYQVYMRRRPYFQKFLEAVAKKFEVVVFTASQPAYADKLLDIVDKDRKLIKHRLFRNSCVCIDGNYIKDLRVLGRDLSKTVLVDNSPQAFGYQIDNGIPILSWFDDDNDRELMKLAPILMEMRKHKDVRSYLQRSFGLTQMIKNLQEQPSMMQYY